MSYQQHPTDPTMVVDSLVDGALVFLASTSATALPDGVTDPREPEAREADAAFIAECYLMRLVTGTGPTALFDEWTAVKARTRSFEQMLTEHADADGRELAAEAASVLTSTGRRPNELAEAMAFAINREHQVSKYALELSLTNAALDDEVKEVKAQLARAVSDATAEQEKAAADKIVLEAEITRLRFNTDDAERAAHVQNRLIVLRAVFEDPTPENIERGKVALGELMGVAP